RADGHLAGGVRHPRPEAAAQGGEGVRGLRPAAAVQRVRVPVDRYGAGKAEGAAVRCHPLTGRPGVIRADVRALRRVDRRAGAADRGARRARRGDCDVNRPRVQMNETEFAAAFQTLTDNPPFPWQWDLY